MRLSDLRATALAGLVLVVSSCGGSTPADTTTAPTSTTMISTTSTTEAEPVLVEDELVGFEERSVVFANVELTVTGVRVSNQELRSYAEGGEPVIDEANWYAYLDMRAENRMTSSLADALDVGSYKLLIDGHEYDAASQMSFLSELTGLLRANTGVDSFLAFPVPQGVDPAAAVLVIGEPPDRRVSLPLTGEVADAPYPLSVPQSGMAEGVGPTNGGIVEFNLLAATLSEDRPHEMSTSPTGLRADEDELFLVLHVRAEKVSGRGSDLLSGGFRLLIDGVPRAPWDVATDPKGSTNSPTVDPGAAVDAWVAFLIPIDAVEVALQVGALDENPGIIPVELPDLP